MLFAVCMRADVVQMENGDRLTGTIVSADTTKLALESVYAGVVELPWDEVRALEASEPLYLGLESGQMLLGTVESEGDAFRVVTEDAGVIEVAKGNVEFFRSASEQRAYDARVERYFNPRLVDLWTGALDFGYALARGNSETQTITLGTHAARSTTRDRITARFTSVYAASDATGATEATANAMRGGIQYNLNLTPRWFVFGSSDLEFDEFQNLDLRFAPAGGLGYKLMERPRGTVDLFGGASLNREFFSTGVRRTSGEIVMGEEITYRYSTTGTLQQKLSFFPNVSETGTYRMTFDMSSDTRLNRWLSWQVTVSDRYVSNPDPGRRRNDLLLTTGLRLSFLRE